ncbi:hypothetical protein GCM10011613_33810 [Cellvibrio zantedeschiae]|uniref:Alginate export domain-containing protein n=1 Tax=Cellvibrio zantedeschiae TaxID=1237077 RepID=A0ABQ3B9L7_9GAMM|nr:alginate export family protein [Cellvibrio zantedeschiae]GGY86031.1 hypothetical protein GCM10011613_33810 [Cellvibrio zantedeschiae]
MKLFPFMASAICFSLTTLVFADSTQQFNFSNRTRYADVNDGNSGKDISTLFRVNLKSQWNEVFSSFVEVDYVKSFLPDDHSDGLHFNEHTMIADAPGADLNQAFVTLKFDDMKFDLGRQRLAYDSQRFIGGNALWQNEQTFDAVSSRFSLKSNSVLNYAYVFNVNRIFGDKADKDFYDVDYNKNWEKPERPEYLLGDHKHKTHLLHLEWNEWDYSQLVAYHYAIRNQDLISDSNNTTGISYSFNVKGDQFKYRLQAEAATQKRTEISNAVQVPYYMLDAGISVNSVELSSRYEVMGAKNNIPFITPLGSLYDFMGWANRFGTPIVSGVEDASLRLLWRASPFRIDARYHVFHEYDGSRKLGDEADIDVVFKPAKKHAVSLRFAYFEPEDWFEPHNHVKKMYLDYTYNL